MSRRGGLGLTLAVAMIAATIGAPAAARAQGGQMPDTTGMGAAMSGMAQQMQQMQDAMPGAQLKKLEYRKGDEWVKFELAPAEVKTGTGVGTMAKAMIGLGGPKSHMVVDGEHATLVLTDSKPRFRFEGEKKAAMSIQLGVFDVADGQRSVRVDAGKPVHFFHKYVELKVEKTGDGVWELTPTKALGPGEYALAASMAGPVADFTIGAGK
jgi:hypothetical protein